MTLLDVAKAIGTTGASVSEWEADKKSPREEALVKLAAFLGVTPAYLRYGVPIEGPDPSRDVKLTDEQIQAARAVRAGETAPRRKKSNGA